MKSFPSTLNKGGSNANNKNTSNSIKDSLVNSFKNAFNSAVSSATTGRNFDTEGIRYSVNQDKKALLEEVKSGKTFISDNSLKYTNNTLFDSGRNVSVENAFHYDQSIFNIVNVYRLHSGPEDILIETGVDNPKDTQNTQFITSNFKGQYSHSLFNPYYGIRTNGIVDNIPLLDGTNDSSLKNNDLVDLSDCSIKELVRLSGETSEGTQALLGLARYKYADFMYCKDLGKISNNHLITLRRFMHPVKDDIFSADVFDSGKTLNNNSTGDIGHLVTWFDTDDNKLEDIMSYEYDSTWKEVQAEIQQKESQEDDPERGLVGGIMNMVNPTFLRSVGHGTTAGTGFNYILNKLHFKENHALYANNDIALGRNYDKNRVYTPINRVWDNHIYEGRIEFRHEFNLNFSYKLRAYDNINPKTAMLDLLGNILAVTHNRGRFWSGEQQILGPQPSASGWNKYNQFINSSAESFHTLAKKICNGDLSDLRAIPGALGEISNKAKDVVKNVASTKNLVSTSLNKLNEMASKVGGAFGKWLDNGGATALTGMVKNRLGRPALYAFDSLISGEDVGYWHVTIGNPKNPIAVFGNLIMTNAKVTHSGPLGIDDFPTELKVSVALKHARPRDTTAIERMYTKGQYGIYLSLASPFTKINYKNANIDNTGKKYTDEKGNIKNVAEISKNGKMIGAIQYNSSTGDVQYIGDWHETRIYSNQSEKR